MPNPRRALLARLSAAAERLERSLGPDTGGASPDWEHALQRLETSFGRLEPPAPAGRARQDTELARLRGVQDAIAALSRLDEATGLLEALERGYIRLLRVAWLLQQPADYLLENRQALEAREAAGERPLLSVAEAVTLLRKARRAVGVVSHGWLTPHHPDPDRKRLQALRRALRELSHIEGLFFDYCSLYQVPRSPERLAMFKKALPPMNQTYASAVGTTVLQARDIPPMPASFRGLLCLFGVRDDVDEAAVRAALARFGTIVEVVDRRAPPLERAGEMSVRFTSHQAVLDVIAAEMTTDLWKGLAALYNDRPYDGRGWVRGQRRRRRRTPRAAHHASARLARPSAALTPDRPLRPPSSPRLDSAAPKTTSAWSSRCASASTRSSRPRSTRCRPRCTRSAATRRPRPSSETASSRPRSTSSARCSASRARTSSAGATRSW